MAIQGGLPVAHAAVFPNGAFVVGEVTALEDFDAAQAARESGREVDTQQRDKNSGMRLWQVRVIDADELARKGQVEVTVKIAAEVQPVPPELAHGVPFRPVEFEDLTVTAYVDTNRSRPRIAWSLRASGMRAPGKAGLRSAQSAQSSASDSSKVA
jgi:hypothetical protein